MDLSRWQMHYNGFRNRNDMRSLESELKKATDDLRVAANKQQRDMANARIRLLNNHIRNLNITRVIGPVTAESLRPGPATQAMKRFGEQAQQAQQARQSSGSARNVGTQVGNTQARSGSPRVVPGATGVLEDTPRGRGGSPAPSPEAVGPSGSSDISGRYRGGGVGRVEGVGPSGVPARIENRGVPDVIRPGAPVPPPSAAVRGASAASKFGGAVKAAGGMLGKVIRHPAVQIGAIALPYVMDALNKRNEELPYGPQGGVMGPPGNKPAAAPAGAAATVKTDTATKTTPAPEKKAYAAQGQMSKAMGVARDSTGQVDKLNPADVKKAEGYMTDLMQRIGKGGWDQPGQERRGTQIGTPGSAKIVQMFKDSKYSDQFTRAEQEEAIKRFKANFAVQTFAGRNKTPAGRSVTPTAQYTGSPERY